MRLIYMSLCVTSLLLPGCAGLSLGGGGFGAACFGENCPQGIQGDYPITDGFRHSLPKPGGRVVVWGGHPAAAGTTINWLQRQGLRIVERVQLQKIFDEQRIQLTHTPDDEAQVLRVGKLLGADAVAFLDTPVTSGSRAKGSSLFWQGSGGSSLDSASVYSTSVWIRGVSIETGEVLWSATARYPQSFESVDHVLALLTCHALATAWGYRQPGRPDILRDDYVYSERAAFFFIRPLR